MSTFTQTTTEKLYLWNGSDDGIEDNDEARWIKSNDTDVTGHWKMSVITSFLLCLIIIDYEDHGILSSTFYITFTIFIMIICG